MNEIILEAIGVTKRFSGFTAVDAVNLQVRKGHIHSLIGPNGAGKTTLFNILTKLFPPTAGKILFRGRDITQMDMASIAREGMIRSFQISAIFPSMTVLENVRLAVQRGRGESFDFWRSGRVLKRLDERAMEFVSLVGLQDAAQIRASNLSYGGRRALEVATTLSLEPEMLLLDEPMAGMGREDVEATAQLLRRISRDRTILMVEHNLSVVADLSDRITVLARGRIIADGDYKTVSSDPAVIEAYIGTGHD